MPIEVFQGLLIPFIGTVLGASCVFFLKGKMNPHVQKALTGFAAGVMVAASIWSLLLPAMDEAKSIGVAPFIPAVVGFWAGTLFLLLLDHVIPHLHSFAKEAEGPHTSLSRTTMLVLAVTLHGGWRRARRLAYGQYGYDHGRGAGTFARYRNTELP